MDIFDEAAEILDALPDDDLLDATEADASDDVEAELRARRHCEILDDFGNWLEELEADDFAVISAAAVNAAADSSPGLSELFGELQALRQETKLVSRSSQGLRNEISEMVAQAKDGTVQQTRLAADLEVILRSQVPNARREARREAVLELLRLYEAVERFAEHSSEPPLHLFMTARRQREYRSAVAEARRLLLSQARELLPRLKIQPVAAVGDKFEAARMRVVATMKSPGTAPGTVVEILRQGYVMDGDLMQFAEVKVVES